MHNFTKNSVFPFKLTATQGNNFKPMLNITE